MSGRKVELDEVIVPSNKLENSTSQKTIGERGNFKKNPTIMQDLSM